MPLKSRLWSPWLAGGLAVAGVLLLTTRARAATSSGGFFQSGRDADLDALASMLISETSFAHSKDEMAQIINVAINRSRKWGVPIPKVVAGPSPGPKLNAWNGSATYKALFSRAPNHTRWFQARAFAQEVLDGAYPNIGATSFIHPGGMPTPPCSGEKRVEAMTIAGRRCIPTWSVGGRVVGKGMFS